MCEYNITLESVRRTRASHFVHFFVEEFGKVARNDLSRFDESAVLGRALEVAFAFDAAVVLSQRFVVLHADPPSRLEVHLFHVSPCSDHLICNNRWFLEHPEKLHDTCWA